MSIEPFDPCDHFFTQANLQSLADRGYLIIEDALSPDFVKLLGQDSLAIRTAGMFKQAGIAQGVDYRVATDIRSDLIYWWDPQAQVMVQRRFWQFAEKVREALNRHLYLGLFDVELHYAIYPCGAFFAKHIDQFRANNQRRISLVLYLNDLWAPEDGGQLRLYDDDGLVYQDVIPKGGVMVLFCSDRVLHEAMPTKRERLSLTGWFRTRP